MPTLWKELFFMVTQVTKMTKGLLEHVLAAGSGRRSTEKTKMTESDTALHSLGDGLEQSGNSMFHK